jgi:hypothetical protein
MSFLLTRINTIKLQGSDAQVRWAHTIRASQVRKLESLGLEGLATIVAPWVTDPQLDGMRVFTKHQTAVLVLNIAAYALSPAQSKWWIETRSEDPQSWLHDAWRECLKHYLAHPFPTPEDGPQIPAMGTDLPGMAIPA